MGKKLSREVVKGVFRMLLEGKSYREIARKYGIGVSTVSYLKEVLDYAAENATTLMYYLREAKRASKEEGREFASLFDEPWGLNRARARLLYAYYLYTGWRIVHKARLLAGEDKLSSGKLGQSAGRLVERFIKTIESLVEDWENLYKSAGLPRNAALSGLYALLDELERLFIEALASSEFSVEERVEPRIILYYIDESTSKYKYVVKIPITEDLLLDPLRSMELIERSVRKLSSNEIVSRITSIVEKYMEIHDKITRSDIDTRKALEKIRLERRKAKKEIHKIIEDNIGREIVEAVYVKTPDQLSKANRINIILYLKPKGIGRQHLLPN